MAKQCDNVKWNDVVTWSIWWRHRRYFGFYSEQGYTHNIICSLFHRIVWKSHCSLHHKKGLLFCFKQIYFKKLLQNSSFFKCFNFLCKNNDRIVIQTLKIYATLKNIKNKASVYYLNEKIHGQFFRIKNLEKTFLFNLRRLPHCVWRLYYFTNIYKIIC